MVALVTKGALVGANVVGNYTFANLAKLWIAQFWRL